MEKVADAISDRKTSKSKSERKTSVNAWRKKMGNGSEMALPSGNICLVRSRPGIDVFLQQGYIPNSLKPLVQNALKGSAKSLSTESFFKNKNEQETEKLLSEMILAMNRVLCFVLLEPAVKMPPMRPARTDGVGTLEEVIPLEERDLDDNGKQIEIDWLYADEVDFDDKNFIFSWALGGSSDLEKFRAEQNANVESVSASEDLAMSSE